MNNDRVKPIRLTDYLSVFYNEWLIDPQRTDYNVISDTTIYGEVDVERFKECTLKHVNNTFAFLVNVINKDNILYWKFRKPEECVVEYFPHKLTDEEIYSLVAKPFDLENDLLARHVLIKEGEKQYRILFIYSHLIADGISTEELFTKWSAYYNGEKVDELPLDVQMEKAQALTEYFDQLMSVNKQGMEAFWKEHLNGISGVDLSFLKRLTPKEKSKHRYVSEYMFSYDSDILSKVKSLRSYKITPYIYGQMVLGILLYKITKQNAIGIPYPIALLEGKDLFYGAHVNTCIIDYRFDETTTVNSLIDKLLLFFKDLKKSKAKYLPITESIQYADNPKVLDIAFSQTFPRDSLVRINGQSGSEMHHKFQIDLVGELLIEQEDGSDTLNYRIRYDKDILDEDLLKNFITLYRKLFVDLLQDLLDNKGDTLIDSYKLLDDNQIEIMTEVWNQTGKDFPKEKTIHELFEEQTLKTPHNIALVFKDKSFTYKELNDKANRLANYLVKNFDVRQEDFIAICQNRTEHILVSMLGILKAGGTYVPMDTKAPEERLRYMLEDINCKVVLTNKEHCPKLKKAISNLQTSILEIDTDYFEEELGKYPATTPKLSVSAHNLAYVIYTSGTTGNPKGVMVEHQGVVNLAFTQQELYMLTTDDGEPVYKNCLWYSNLVFDAHVCDVYPALVHGHTIYMVDEDTRLDIEKLSAYIIKHQINHGLIPPALLDKNIHLNVNPLIVGGEAASLDVMKSYREQGVSVLNLYGPTEITCISSQHYFESDGDSHRNIGKPYQNKTYYVLDQNLNIVPIGVPGELHIGGIGVARGYLNNEVLTDEKFIPNPFQTSDEKNAGRNARLYKTGDMVRYMPNGDIEYIGRNDFQVKIRGFRIELGEIEAVLSGYGAIKQAVVVAKEHVGNGSKYLVGYYLSDTAYNIDVLLQYLSERLPDYMVPSTLVHITSIPLTVNGKVDYKALPEPEIQLNTHYVLPDNETEKRLCEIYGEVLGFSPDSISVLESFFKLGGDSIRGIQLVSKIRQQLGIYIGVKDLYKYNTIRSLSKELIKASFEEKELKTEQGILEGDVKLLPIQEWFFSNVDKKLLPEYNHWNQGFMLSVPQLDINLLYESIKKLTIYHDAFRLVYKRDAHNKYKQSYQKALADINFDHLDISTLSDAKELDTILTRWQSKFDIYSTPLFHIGYLYGYEDNTARIHISVHHLIIDAVSWRIIKTDLHRIYSYLLTESENGNTALDQISVSDILGTKRSSYRQWTETVSEYKKNDIKVLDQEVQYWDSVTDGVVDYNRLWLAKQVEKPNHIKISLGCEIAKRIQKASVHNVYNTQVNDLLLAALTLTLSDITKSNEHYVTLEGHGREAISDDIDINNTVGWFTSLYPVRLSTFDGGDAKASVISVKDTLNRMPEHGIGYGAINGYIKHELPVVAFNYLGLYDSRSNNDEWALVNENVGETVSPLNKDHNAISLNCGIIEDELVLFVTGQLPIEDLNAFASIYQNKIDKVILSLEKESRSYLTLSDVDFIISEDYLNQIQKRHEVEGVYLANSLQQGFVYHALNQGDKDHSYRTQLFWDYHNALDVSCLKQAWIMAQEKFPTLRLRFAWQEELVQIIDKKGNQEWYYFDISDKEENAQDTFYSDLMKQDTEQVYDLSAGSLFRVYLIKRNDNYYNFIFNSHHSILDGWSNPILLKYVHETYLALLKGNVVPPERDQTYALTQKYLQRTNSEQKEFWNNYLKQIQERENLNNLMLARSKEKNISDFRHVEQPRTENIVISGIRYEQLKEQCSKNGITENVFFQYCWHKYLSIYTSNRTTIVGMVTSGRDIPLENIDQSVGLFINTLPTIVQHNDDDEKLINLLKALQDDINEVNSRSNINLADLHHGGDGRLFNTLFAFENYPAPKNLGDGELDILFVESKEKQDYPLTIAVLEQDQEIHIRLNYAGELFDKDIVTQLLNGFITIADQFIANPQIAIKDLQLISDQEKEKQIYEWNSTYNSSLRLNKTIHGLFEEQVIKTPDNIALVCGDSSLSYTELDRRANKFASYLSDNYDIKPDDIIGICLNRTEDVLVSILGILKAGGAYLPISPDAPDARISFMLNDACCKVLVTNEIYYSRLTALCSNSNIRVLPVDSEALVHRIAQMPDVAPFRSVCPSNLAYIIYTSGTSGNPKGVMIEHHNVINLVYALEDIYHVKILNGEPDYKNYLWYSNLIFDAHVYDVYPVLMRGHSLFLIDESTRLDLKKLSDYVVRNNIEGGLVPPVLLDNEYILDLKTLIVGGESTALEIMQNYRKQGTNIYNAYGPTEITVSSSHHKFELGDSNTNIGKPLSNVSYYILNESRQLLPLGASGELYIGGMGVARGYLNHPGLTDEYFIENPFQTDIEKRNEYNGRLYKSGDLVRYLPNGDVEYVGRKDNQVKIRGFRIELKEIEQNLSDYESVNQSVAQVYQHSNGLKYIVGYYTSDVQYAQDELHDYMSMQLPDYMVPSVFIHLDKFPMTLNGKLDYRALPKPDFYEHQSAYVAPRNGVEQYLCQIYGEILDLDSSKISIDDDFFTLGGSSILAIRLVVKISKGLDCNVELFNILKYKTIRKLAEYLANNSKGNSRPKISKIEVAEPQEQLLSFAQERFWFLQTFGAGNVYNIPVVWEIKDSASESVLLSAIRKIISRHEILRSLIKMTKDGIGYQSVIADNVPYTVQTLIVDSKEALSEAISETVNRPFDISNEIPIHVQLYKWEQKTFISLVVHHIAFDGWSLDVFINELLNYYNYYQCKQDGGEFMMYELPDPEIQYKDFALWQRQYLSETILKEQLDYWKNRLSEYETLILPTDYVRPVQFDHSGDNVLFEIPQRLSGRLRTISKNENISLYSVLLSGYYILLSAFSNQKDILVGTPIAGRHYEEISNAIGSFVNTIILRHQIDADQSIIDYIEAVGREVNEALQYQDLPFEKLVDELNVEKDTSRNPIFQVMFGVQSFGKKDRSELNKILSVYDEDVSTNRKIAQFDFTMMLDDSEDSIKGLVNYATSLFRPDTILNYINTYIKILEQIVSLSEDEQKKYKIADINYLSSELQSKLIHTWNPTYNPFPDLNKTIHQLFEEQALNNPDKIAIVTDNASLSYGQLNEKANRLANYLIDYHNIRLEDVVAIGQTRSEYFLISVLGILKAGGAYVPIDIEAPEARLRHMIKDTDSKLILTNEVHKSKLDHIATEAQIPLVEIDSVSLATELDACLSATPANRSTPDNLCYIIYTSGTTGLPKGVMIEHKGVINLTHNGLLGVKHPNSENDNVLCYYNFVFDAHVYEIYSALLHGYTLHMIDEALRLDPSLLASYIKEYKIERAAIPPVFLDKNRVLNVKTLIVGGEPTDPEILESYRRHGVEVVNSYGPTEVTVCSSEHRFEIGDSNTNVGKPIQNVTYYVFNESNHLLPVGAVGELHIGGIGVARGYLNDIALTNAKFIQNPYQTSNEKDSGYNGRLYKTGDLVRYLPDGDIEFISRKDFQVKIRGFRIEIKEIERSLSDYPPIRQVAILVRKHSNDTKYIAAYYTSDVACHQTELHRHMGERLPDYMIPSVFVHLDKFPMTINGKLDYKALPEPDFQESQVNYVPPKDNMEEKLCAIYGEILDLDPSTIGVEDDFFALGGSSILAIRLVARVNTEFNSEINVMDALSATTIRSLLVRMSHKKDYQPIIPLSENRSAPLFMLHPLMSDSDIYKPLSEKLGMEYCCYGVNSYNLHNDKKIDNLNRLADLYLTEIDKINQNRTSYTFLGWSLGGRFALEIASLLEKRGVTDITVYLLDTWMMDIRFGESEAEKQTKMDLIMDTFNIPSSEREKTRKVLLVEEKLGSQSLSRLLQHTKVLLFRAMDDPNTIEYRHQYANNNVEQCLDDATRQLKVTDVNCDHNNILKSDSTIARHIKEYNASLQ